MKNNNIKIAIVEAGSFYHNIIGSQILELSSEKKLDKLNWIIKSFESPDELMNNGKSAYQLIFFDSYLKNNSQKKDDELKDIKEALKIKNKNCLFISVSGYREMIITAELLKEGETQFFYSKLCNLKDERLEEYCSVPSMHKLIDRFLNNLPQSASVLIDGVRMKISA